MKTTTRRLTLVAAALLLAGAAFAAGSDSETVQLFKNAGESGKFFGKSYGYAVFPTIGKGGIVVGGAYGKGRVYEQGRDIGEVSVTQVSVGFQLGGQAYSEIIFFKNKATLDDFTSGNYEFGADVGAVAITAAGMPPQTEGGASAGASGGKKDAVDDRRLPQGHRGVHDRQGRPDVPGHGCGQKFSYKARSGRLASRTTCGTQHARCPVSARPCRLVLVTQLRHAPPYDPFERRDQARAFREQHTCALGPSVLATGGSSSSGANPSSTCSA